MNKKVLFALSILSAVTVCFSLLLYAKKSNLAELTNNDKVIQRKYKLVNLNLISQFELAANVVNLKYCNSHLYIYDFDKQRILSINTKGEVTQAYGKRGSGPGEFIQIMGWDVNSSMVRCVDLGTLSVSCINHQNKVIEYSKFDKSFFCATPLNENLYLMRGVTYSKEKKPGTSFSSIFWLLDTKLKTQTEVPILLPEETTVPELAYSGFFANSSSGDMRFFVCDRAGYFFAFDKAGKFKYLARTTDNFSLPKIVINEGGSASFDAKSPFTSCSASSTDKYLFVLSVVNEINVNPKSRGGVIDVYDVNDGHYLWSFELPKVDNAKSSAIAITENQIFAYYGEKIVVFTYSE